MNVFKKFNIFNFLLVIASFAFMMRLFDISNFSTGKSIAESTPAAQQFQPVENDAVAAPKDGEVVAAASPAPATETAPKKEEKEAESKAAGHSAAPPPVYGEQGFSASEVEILQSLAVRRSELDKREQQISQREALLKAAGGEVDRKIAELNKLRGELEDLLNKQKTAEDERINSLVKIYENMKPKDAANIFNTLDMDVLLPVIAKISERKSSPILAAMDPEKAREVTIKLAEQRRLPKMPVDSEKTKAPSP